MSLADLQKLAQTEIENQNNKSSEGYSTPLLYPHENGTFRVKLLYKEEAGIIQKRIVRHTVGKEKLACLSQYGQGCPICDAINRAEELDKDCGAYQKYKPITRGICYAILVDHDPGMFKGNNDPKKGDLVLLMYPQTIYNEFNNIIVKSGEHIESLVAKNYGKTIEITRSQKNGGYPEYKVSVYPYGDEKVKNTEEEWNALMESVPNISDVIIPKSPTEELLEKIKVAGETIVTEYLSGNIINPTSNVPNASTPNNSVAATPLDTVVSVPESTDDEPLPFNADDINTTSTTNQSNGKPECFGQHSDTENKCLICAYEADCLMSNK